MKKFLLFLLVVLGLASCRKDPNIIVSEFVDQVDSTCVGRMVGDESDATQIVAVSYQDSVLLFDCQLSDEAEHDLGLLELTAEDNLMPDIHSLVGNLLDSTQLAETNPDLWEIFVGQQTKVIFRVKDETGESFELVAKEF